MFPLTLKPKTEPKKKKRSRNPFLEHTQNEKHKTKPHPKKKKPTKPKITKKKKKNKKNPPKNPEGDP